jgi:hypothetical protein
LARKGYNDRLKNKTPSNDNGKDDDIGNSIEKYLTLNRKESSIEKDQVTQEGNPKVREKFIMSLKK